MVTSMASVKLVNGSLHQPHHYHHPVIPSPSPPQPVTRDCNGLPRKSRGDSAEAASDTFSRDLSSPYSAEEGSDLRDSVDPSDANGLPETPTKKNKRKRSEPKKRGETGSKKPRADSPGSSSHAGSASDEHDEIASHKEVSNGYAKLPVSLSSSSSFSSSSKSHKQERKDKPSPSSSQNVTSQAEGSSSSSSNHINAVRATLPNGVPSPFIHPLFAAGMPPSALGFVPSLYFGGRTFPHPGVPPTFPTLPLQLQQNYIAAATAAAAAAAAAAAQTPSSPPVSASGSSTSMPTAAASTAMSRPSSSKTDTFVSSSLGSSHHPGSLSVSRHPSSVKSAKAFPPPLPPPPHPSSFQTSSHRPGHSRTVDPNEDEDEEDGSRADSPEDLTMGGGGKMSRKQRKNYKNMTRERRVEANARERTRVHTISAAFDALRRAVPSYSYNQKLSKLAILRIACSYIMALARLTDQDYTSASEHIQKPLSFAECVDMCTNTIQTEGRARRRH